MPSPGRPPTILDAILIPNGSPLYLGRIVSTGTAVDNSSTAVPFNYLPRGGLNLANTLAGRQLLLQPTAAGYIMASEVNPSVVGYAPVTNFNGSNPGPLLAAQERVLLCMLPTQGWLSFIPDSGSANLMVWELS